MNFIDFFNTKLVAIKTAIGILYEDTKTQYLKQLSKSFASYIELRHVFPKRADYADDFQDLTRVVREDNLVLDRDGYNLGYIVTEKKFRSDVYSMATYPMYMQGGQAIPGSDFQDIFNDDIGFWGYRASTATESYFTVDFQQKESINKVFLSTNNTLDVDLYIKEDYDKEWVHIAARAGLNHVWNFKAQDAVALKFVAVTALFVVSRLQAGLAAYQQTGIFESDYYTIADLYHLKLTTDKDVPENTTIDFSILIGGQSTEHPIKDDAVISGGVIWHTASGVFPAYMLPASYIPESLTVKVGYNEWDAVDTYDWAWTVVPATDIVASSGALQLSSEYKVIEGSLQKVMLGGTAFQEGLDYSVSYNVNSAQITVTRLANSSIPIDELNTLSYAILARKREAVKQLRTYVQLASDSNIILQNCIVPFNVRHVVMKNDIVRDTTQDINAGNMNALLSNIDGISSYVISGQAGTNLIEVTFFDGTGAPTFPDPLSLDIINVEHFSKGYRLMEVVTSPNEHEYSIEPVITASGIIDSYTMTTGAGPKTLQIDYAQSLAQTMNIKLKATFISTDGTNTPTLRSYKIENTMR